MPNANIILRNYTFLSEYATLRLKIPIQRIGLFAKSSKMSSNSPLNSRHGCFYIDQRHRNNRRLDEQPQHKSRDSAVCGKVAARAKRQRRKPSRDAIARVARSAVCGYMAARAKRQRRFTLHLYASRNSIIANGGIRIKEARQVRCRIACRYKTPVTGAVVTAVLFAKSR